MRLVCYLQSEDCKLLSFTVVPDHRYLYEATYLEAKSAVVCSVFLSVGTGAW